MIKLLRRTLFEILVTLAEREVKHVRETLTQEQEDGMLSQLWQNPAFRNYIADRNAKLMFMMAGGEGMEPEPRDKYHLHAGQRVENLLIGSKAKLAYDRTTKRRVSTTGQDNS